MSIEILLLFLDGFLFLMRSVACQYHWCSIYRGLERVGSWVPGGSVGRDQLAMVAKVRRHWFNPCRLGSRGHLGANFSLLLYTDWPRPQAFLSCGIK